MKYERLTDKNNLYWAIQETPLTAEVGIYLTDCLNRLAEFEDKIEQGTLIELACKKGDKVYQADCVRVYELTVLGIRVFNNKFYYETQGVGFDNTAIGKSIFLTREEAEKRLKELQK